MQHGYRSEFTPKSPLAYGTGPFFASASIDQTGKELIHQLGTTLIWYIFSFDSHATNTELEPTAHETTWTSNNKSGGTYLSKRVHKMVGINFEHFNLGQFLFRRLFQYHMQRSGRRSGQSLLVWSKIRCKGPGCANQREQQSGSDR